MDRYLLEPMDKFDRSIPPRDDADAASDLARRLARYRRRVEAEGRSRSLKLIDRAIEDADSKAGDS